MITRIMNERKANLSSSTQVSTSPQATSFSAQNIHEVGPRQADPMRRQAARHASQCRRHESAAAYALLNYDKRLTHSENPRFGKDIARETCVDVTRALSSLLSSSNSMRSMTRLELRKEIAVLVLDYIVLSGRLDAPGRSSSVQVCGSFVV